MPSHGHAWELDAPGCCFVEIKNSGGDTTGSAGCHWRWAWSSDGEIEYSNVKGEAEASYAAASNPKKEKNLAFSIGIEFDWEQIDVLCALGFQ